MFRPRLPIVLVAIAFATGCGPSPDDDTAADDSAFKSASCTLDVNVEMPGSAPRKALIAAIHESWLETGAGPSLEAQPNEYVVQRLTTSPDGRVETTIKVQSCAAGSAAASCQRSNPAGKKGGPIEWAKTTFPAAFKKKAVTDNGFVFTAFMKTDDCGKTFAAVGELSVPGLDDSEEGDDVSGDPDMQCRTQSGEPKACAGDDDDDDGDMQCRTQSGEPKACDEP
jgi:hypothetical protein